MKVLGNFLTLASLFSIVICLENTDFCHVNKKDCKRGDLEMTKKCMSLKCHGKYPFSCSPDHCSTNETTCRELFNMVYRLKSYNSLKMTVFNEKAFEQKLAEYRRLMKSIKACSIRKYDVSIDDVCLSGSECLLKQDLPLRYGEITIVSSIDCPCQNPFPFTCGKHCAKNKAKCNEFNLKTKVGKITELGGCANDKKVIHFYLN
jgi:hypothetical protein